MIAYINGQFPAVRLSSSGGLQQVSDSKVQQCLYQTHVLLHVHAAKLSDSVSL